MVNKSQKAQSALESELDRITIADVLKDVLETSE